MLLAVLLFANMGSGPSLDAFIVEVNEMVLSGQPMPPAFLREVQRLPSASDRLQALVYLRRSGLFSGSVLPLDKILGLPDSEQNMSIGDNADES